MTITTTDLESPPLFLCPYCHSPLIPQAKTWLCEGNMNEKGTKHPFDVARQGYVNLLPVQNKKTKEPGDSQESIEARHRFLDQGFYQPLQQKVAQLAAHFQHTDNNTDLLGKQRLNTVWLDVGCGEGYYTQAIADSLEGKSNVNNALIAVDISKPAVATTARAAKQNQQLWYQLESKQQQSDISLINSFKTSISPMVASASHLPLKDSSIDAISSIFSPILAEEFARVLKAGGRLIIAKPDAGHLQSLREALFDEVRPHDSDKFLEELAPLFELKQTHHVQADLSLDLESLTDLLTMTPYSYRAKAEKRAALLTQAKKQDFNTKAKFVVYELVKK